MSNCKQNDQKSDFHLTGDLSSSGEHVLVLQCRKYSLEERDMLLSYNVCVSEKA
jgi:hypothetical protein